MTLNILFLITLFLSCNFIAVNRHSPTVLKYAGTEAAFDFYPSQEWLNAKESISLLDLRGKIVLLHFWKYSCINCIHTLAELKKLESKWKKELVVIGIHSPKFSTERNLDSVKAAIQRNEIKHPVLNDTDFTLWRQYNINSWPTLILIDPRGMVFGIQEGEGIFEGFDKIISGMSEEFKQAGLMNLSPVSKLEVKSAQSPESILSFPGKLIVNDKGTELFVSDTNHNRILRIDTKAKRILDIIGRKEAGFKDGKFLEAKFHHPQGLSLSGDTLYIADSENHSIRLANLKSKTVRTLAGTGEQARSFNVPGRGREVAFNSPWDLILNKNKLYITMRGSHQIWTLDIQTLEAEVYAGVGNENLFDGKLSVASLGQPTGITQDSIKFYFVDSEISAVRSLGIKTSPIIQTLVGKGLLAFGDIDGLSSKARLQYPMGITHSSGKLYIADTMNHKIKQLDLEKNEITTLAGNGKHGSANGDLSNSSFFEPTGIAVFENLVYVADTNNHLIRILDLETNTVSNFEFE